MEENTSADIEATPGASSGKRKSPATPDIEPRSSGKRQRVPVSRFQSPLEELEVKFKPEKKDEKKDDNTLLYKKSCFLAVRGAEGSFYLCRAAQNIYKKSKRLRIQWLSLDKNPDVYKFDYVDSTEMETVLTEINMTKVTKDSYKLPSDEQKRIEKILDRAIRVEQGIATADEVEEEALDDNEDSMDTEEDEDDDDDEEEEVTTSKRGRKKSTSKGARSKSSTPAQKKKGKAVVGKSKGAKQNVKVEKKKGPDRNLKPNPKIKVLEKDPFFESRDKVPKMSPRMATKIAFRAVNLNDVEMLKELLVKKEGLTGLNIGRSVHDERTPLDLAVEQGKTEIIKLLTREIWGKNDRKPPPAPLISSMGTGEYNYMSLGVGNIRALNVSRGGKQGNDAFLKETNDGRSTQYDFAKRWLERGVSQEAIDTFLLECVAANEDSQTKDELLQEYIINHAFDAILYGHRALAGKYIAEAERLGGFGINFLHKEVLTFDKENLRDIILAASVRKKPFGNNGITPLHCAAINPNVKYLTRLLSIEPDINMQTKSRARPIHFAAACEGTGPLDFLLNRNANPYEPDTAGEIPIHFASRSGRSKNIDLLMKHASGAVDGSLNPKWGAGCVNRPNRFSFTPLHLAVKGGHVDAIRTLIKHGADINKPLSAGQDKATPLMLAAQRGDLNVVRILIQSGANIEVLDKLKRTALTHAIINGCANVASYLLLLGADPDRVDSSNNSLVHYAAAYGWHACLKLLLKDAGAKPDVPNDWQTTPINIAFLMGNHGLVEYLFNHKGVDINFTSESGRTLASVAAGARLVTGLDDQIKYLIENCKADATIADVNGMTALHYLAKNNIKLKGNYYRNPELDEEAQALSVKIAEILIDAGCNVMRKSKEGKTPLMLAIEQVNVDLVKFLVQRGAYVSPEQNRDEKSVLHLMAEQCCMTDLQPVLKILVENKLKQPSPKKNVEKEATENGEIAAMNSTEEKMDTAEVSKPNAVVSENKVKPTEPSGETKVNGEKETESMEVEGEAKVELEELVMSPMESLKKMASTRDFLGFTPLLRACQVYRDFKILKEEHKKTAEKALDFINGLLELAGSDVNDIVGHKNMPDVKEPQYSDDGKCSALHFMIKAPSEENKTEVGPGLKLIMRYSPNPNLLDIHEKSPLVMAVEGNKIMAVKALLEAGAHPNILIKVPKDTVTPLMLAAERGSFNIMSLLIKAKANVIACGESMRTPIHILVTNRAHEDETIAMIQTLLEAGSNINAEDKYGITPLHLAVYHNKGHSDTSNSLEEFLLDRGANVFAKDSEQNMALHAAVNKPGVDPIELCSLLTSAMRDQRVDEHNSMQYTPLLHAATSGATICCMHLLQRGANLEAKENRGNTALNLAVYGGYDSCAIMLMQRKASVSNPIVISLAKKKEDLKKEEEKVKKRPCLTWRPKRQWENDQMKDIPAKTVSIFESAIHNDLTGVAHMLLDALGVPTQVIESALNLSKFYLALRLLRRIPDASRLQSKNKDGQNLFHVLACKTNNQHPDLQIKVAGALLEKGVPLNERDRFGMTPLMWAALKHQSVPLAKFFIENDLRYDPRVKDVFGRDTMAAFMWEYNWVSETFKTTLVQSWLQLLMKEGKMSLDTTYDHPLPDPLLLGATISCNQPDYFETKSTSRTTPLIFAIRNYDFGMAKFMLQSGANPNFTDSNGMTPMMHAAIMNDLKMVKLLLNYSYSAAEDAVIDVGKPELVSQSSRQVFPINFEITKEKNPDDLIDEEAPEAEEDDDISLSKHTEENEESVVLDEDEEDVNMSENAASEVDENEENEEDSDHDTDIMDDDADDTVKDTQPQSNATKLNLTRHVSQLHKEKTFSSIEKTSNVDLSVCDKNRWTALHHAVCALDNASFDNAEIVYVLGKAGAPLEAENDKGQTPLALAYKNDSVHIVKVLNQLLVQAPYNKTLEPVKRNPPAFEVQELMMNKIQPDYHADANAMLETQVVNQVDKGAVKVDDNCEIKTTGEVAYNAATNIPYHIILSKVDVSASVWGMFNFYKLQIVKHTAKKLFVLFTRWGRIGDRGQFQHTPFQTLEEASKEFCKVYRAKTGNDWNQKTPFVSRPKKYRLMNVTEKRPKTKKINFNFESSHATTLPEPIYDVVNEMSSVTMFDASVEHFGLDESVMPFGRIKREILLEARKILTEISEMIDKSGKLKNNLTRETEAEYQSCSEELIKLTNEYYHLVPISGFENESIRPIHDKKTLRAQTRLLNELLDLQIANTILLGANLKKNELNHVDYIYSCLGCSLQPLPEVHPESQLILTNIHASVPTANINRIFKVSRNGENERLASTNLPNHQLLWHGSSMSNFISILSRGLLVAPPEVPWSGHLFGEGIYFADTFMKSMHYCHNHNPKSHCKVMLLCEVALGNSKIDVSHSDEDHLDSDINSLKILGRAAPIADFDARLPYGASLSLGQVREMKYHPPAFIHHNEYIIHNADQIALRYMVLFNG